MVANVFAVGIGCRYGSTSTLVPSRATVVAGRERSEHDEWVVIRTLSHEPLRDEPTMEHVMTHPEGVGTERLGLHREVDHLTRRVETPTVGGDVTEAQRQPIELRCADRCRRRRP